MPGRRKSTTRTPRTTALETSTWQPTTYVWRRLHGGDLIAEVTPVRGMGSWHVTAYRTEASPDAAHAPRAFTMLRDAHDAADGLLSQHFSHSCVVGVCGRWIRWPQQ